MTQLSVVRRAGARASRRFRPRWFWIPVGVLALAHATFGVALSRFVSAWFAVGLAAALYGATFSRLMAQMRDRPRPRFITVLLDQPLFAHFGASVFAALVSPLCLFAAVAQGAVFESWRAALGMAYLLGFALSAWSIWIERHFVRVRRMDVEITSLPRELDGYTITQLSDLHVGSFDPKKRALQWAALSNALNPDLAVVTGDLVTSGTAFYVDVADAIATLRAKDGVFVSMGNHDQAHNDELSRLVAARGPTVLRNDSRVIQRGAASLVVAGLDGRIARSDVARIVAKFATGAPFVLLSHYPWAFEAAASAGADLMLTGHTHGGQLGVPFLSQRYNLARMTGQLSRGLYFSGKAAMYVNAGLGTTGPPMRLAVPPEIALITLRCAATA